MARELEGGTAGSRLSRSARALAYVSLGAACLVFTVARLGFEPMGFEAALALAGLCIWISVLAAAASIIASAVLWFEGRSAGPVPGALSLLALGLVGAALYGPG